MGIRRWLAVTDSSYWSASAYPTPRLAIQTALVRVPVPHFALVPGAPRPSPSICTFGEKQNVRRIPPPPPPPQPDRSAQCVSVPLQSHFSVRHPPLRGSTPSSPLTPQSAHNHRCCHGGPPRGAV